MPISSPAPAASSSTPLLIATLATGFIASAVTMVLMAPDLARQAGLLPSPAAAHLAIMSDAVGAYLTADATTLTAGGTTVLRPSCGNSTSGSIDQGIGSIPLNRSNGVQRGIMPETTTTYTLTCSNPGLSPSSKQASVTVTVNPNPDPNALVIYLSPDDNTITSGQSTNIRAYCHNGVSMNIDHGVGTKTPPAVVSVSPTVTTTYSATCYGPNYPGDPTNQTSSSAAISVVKPDLYPSFNGPMAGWTATAGIERSYYGAAYNVPGGDYSADPTVSGTYRNLLQRADSVVAGVPTNVQDATTIAGGNMAGGYDYLSIPYTFPLADAGNTRYLRVCVDKTSAADAGSIDESNEGNNCSGWVMITVSAGAPDLTAGAVSVGGVNPPQAVAGSANTFTAVLSNNGSAGTTSTFVSLLQRGTDMYGSGASDIGTYPSVSSIAVGATETASFSYTPAADDAGHTLYYRVCADKSSAGNTGSVAESDENNNCGAWTAVSIVSASNGITSCTPSPATAAPDQPVTWTAIANVSGSPSYSWTVTGGNPDNGSGSPNTFTSSFATGGNYAPTVTVTPGNASASCTPVQVSGAPYTCAAAVTPAITASPARIVAGNPTTISWSATGISAGTTCTVTGPNIGGAGVNTTTSTVSDTSCNVTSGASNSSSISNITTQSVYTITCGATSQQAIVNVLPKFKEF